MRKVRMKSVNRMKSIICEVFGCLQRKDRRSRRLVSQHMLKTTPAGHIFIICIYKKPPAPRRGLSLDEIFMLSESVQLVVARAFPGIAVAGHVEGVLQRKLEGAARDVV